MLGSNEIENWTTSESWEKPRRGRIEVEIDQKERRKKGRIKEGAIRMNNKKDERKLKKWSREGKERDGGSKNHENTS